MGEVNGIAITRTFKHLGTCPVCGGVTFNFREHVIWLGEMPRSQREKMRQLVAEGSQLKDILEKSDLHIVEEDRESSICEKCGYRSSWPVKGGR